MKIKTDWKPIELNAAILNQNFEDLIGIEECTDYEFELGDKKGKKRKVEEEDETPVKSVKKKKKGKNKLKKQENGANAESIELLSPSKAGSTLVLDENIEVESIEPKKDVDMLQWSTYGLPESILKGLEEKNFTSPTEIQALTLPPAIFGRKDILGAAETGSGKTLAFGLPILSAILKMKESDAVSDEEGESDSDLEENDSVVPRKSLYALILTPTRELAMQIKNHIDAAAKYTGIKTAVVVGGMAQVKQERILSKSPEIVIATPGRIWELIDSRCPHLSQISNIKFLVIDETDRMLERGHFVELHNILQKINENEENKKKRQNFVFSATLTLVHDLPKYLVNKSKKISNDAGKKLQKVVNLLGITDPKIVDITQGTGMSNTLTECRITCKITEKDFYVYYFLLKHPGRTLIFCNSIGCVKRLATLLGLLELSPLPLHASMQQRQRLKNLDKFRDTPNSILVATDVAARGLDIPAVEHVLHYQTPRTSEGYVHRSGRTARASNQGITVLLIEPTELPNYVKLCRTLGKTEDLPLFPVSDKYLNAVKLRVNLARELDKLQLHVKKANSEEGWFENAAKKMDMIVDHMSKKFDSKEVHKDKKLAEIKRKQLTSLLGTPVFPKGFSGKYPLSTGQPIEGLFNSDQTAIDSVKESVEMRSKDKIRSIPIFRVQKNKGKSVEKKGGIKLIGDKKGGQHNQKQKKRQKGRK